MVFAGSLKVGQTIRWGERTRRIAAIEDVDDDQALVVTFADGGTERLEKSLPVSIVKGD